MASPSIRPASKNAAGSPPVQWPSEPHRRASDVDSHTRTSALRLHHALLTPEGRFATPDDIIRMDDEPSHQELCNRVQELFLDAIHHDRDMSGHVQDAINSLRIVLAADESVRTGQVVML